MFERFFRPRCPCDPEAKRWIESRLAWLVDQLCYNVFTDRNVITPTPRYFPKPFIPSLAGVRALAADVAEWMDVEPDRVQIELDRLDTGLSLVDARGRAVPSGAAGLYEFRGDHRTIVLGHSELHSPANLVGTIAHEFAHERLIGEGRVSGDEFDNELLTDLTVVHLGLGIFLANSPRNWEAQQSYWPGTRLTRPEYMSPPMFGYALGHIAWHWGDRKPPWRRYLGPAVRSDFDQATRFLFETGMSDFTPARTG